MNPRFSIQWALQWAHCTWWPFFQTILAGVIHCLTLKRDSWLQAPWYLECHFQWNFLFLSRTFLNLQAFECKVCRSGLIYWLLCRRSQRRALSIEDLFMLRSTTPWHCLHRSCICSNFLTIHCTWGQRIWRHENAYLCIHCSTGDNWSYSSKSTSRNRRRLDWNRRYIYKAWLE